MSFDCACPNAAQQMSAITDNAIRIESSSQYEDSILTPHEPKRGRFCRSLKI